MKISAILAQKGSAVATIQPGAAIADAVAELTRHNIGALVVSSDGNTVEGIVSERDVVRVLDKLGEGVLGRPVRTIMSADVQTCAPDDTIEDLMVTMTERRFRHLPVVEDGVLAGMMSIGDVVKARIGELENDRKLLEDYITAR